MSKTISTESPQKKAFSNIFYPQALYKLQEQVTKHTFQGDTDKVSRPLFKAANSFAEEAFTL